MKPLEALGWSVAWVAVAVVAGTAWHMPRTAVMIGSSTVSFLAGAQIATVSRAKPGRLLVHTVCVVAALGALVIAWLMLRAGWAKGM